MKTIVVLFIIYLLEKCPGLFWSGRSQVFINTESFLRIKLSMVELLLAKKSMTTVLQKCTSTSTQILAYRILTSHFPSSSSICNLRELWKWHLILFYSSSLQKVSHNLIPSNFYPVSGFPQFSTLSLCISLSYSLFLSVCCLQRNFS